MSDYDDINYGETLRGLREGMRVFGARYILKRKLGRGGMGEVWLAEDTELEEAVALKFLPEIARQDPVAIDDLRRETRKSRRLAHPNIVRVHDFLLDEQYAAISMEFIEGKTLSELRLRKPNKVFECEDLELIVKQLCGALDYAHRDAKIVHRDLKPANVMQAADGRHKIADFGISASITDTVSRASVHASSSGTPVYMSPQQLMGDKPSESDDIYSFGALLYELLTGKPPFYTGNVIVQVQSKEPPSVSDRREELEVSGESIPENWNRLISACLSKSPEDRPGKALEIVSYLNQNDQSRARHSVHSSLGGATINCTECEAEIPESAKFCNHCGAQIERPVQEPHEIQESVSSPPVSAKDPLPPKNTEAEIPHKIPQGTPIKVPLPKREVETVATAPEIHNRLSHLIKGIIVYGLASVIIGLLFGNLNLSMDIRNVRLLTAEFVIIAAYSMYAQFKTKNPLMVLLFNLVLVFLIVRPLFSHDYPLEFLIDLAGQLYLVGMLIVVGSVIFDSIRTNISEVNLTSEFSIANRLFKLPTILLLVSNIAASAIICYMLKVGIRDMELLNVYSVIVLPVLTVGLSFYLVQFLHVVIVTILLNLTTTVTFDLIYDHSNGPDFVFIAVVTAVVVMIGGLCGHWGKYYQRKMFEKSKEQNNLKT